MSRVFLAIETALDRPIVLKLLPPELVPFLGRLEHCTASTDAPLSLSRDHTRDACTGSRATPDLWLVTDFDPERS